MFGEKQAEAIIGPYSAPLAPRGCSRRVSHLPATQVYITVKMKTKKIHSSRDDGFYFNSRHQLGHISISGKNNHSWIWFFQPNPDFGLPSIMGAGVEVGGVGL